MKYITKILTTFINLIFPIECLNCQSEDVWLCSDCLNKILTQAHQQTTCPICNAQGYNNAAVCPKCQKIYELDKVFIAADYENELIQKLIKTFKYNFIRDLSVPIAEIMINYFSKINLINLKTLKLNQLIIIPSPLSKKRLKWRGFNQSDLLARYIAEKLKIKYYPDLIVKTKHTQEQAELNREQRLLNVKNIFQLKKNCPNIKGQSFLIIDDVITTGATLGEMAKLLKANGAKEIWALVVAKN
jgi:competence protein ComFC